MQATIAPDRRLLLRKVRSVAGGRGEALLREGRLREVLERVLRCALEGMFRKF